MPTACPPGQTSLGCLLGIPLPGTPATVLKAEVAIPAAGQRGASLTATISIPAAPGLPVTRLTVGATAAGAAPAPAPPRPGATAGTGTPPAARAAAPPAGAAWPAGPGAPASAASAVGVPLSALGAFSPAATAPRLTFPTVTPGQSQPPASALSRPLDGVSTVSDRLPLTSGQLQLQADALGLLAIALVVSIARVSVPSRIPRLRRTRGSLTRHLPGQRADRHACQDAALEAAPPASASTPAP